MAEALEVIKELFIYILHPTWIFIDIWNWIVGRSYVVCLLIAIISFLLSLFGYKKYVKAIPLSICIYILLQAIGVIER